MRTIRRLYLYLVSLISLEVVLWGLIGLARSTIAGGQIGSGVSQLASALSLIFVGVPVFLLHWWLVQRSIRIDPDERPARLRAIFLYGSLSALMVPVAQNILAAVNRLWLDVLGLSARNAILGVGQSLTDNLIAIVMNGLLAAYIFSVLRADWAALPPGDTFPETRRLYRYFWVVYGLGFVAIGVQQVLNFILDSSDTLGEAHQAALANGLALLIVGAPIWFYAWRVVQRSQNQPEERQSTLRMVILYVLSLIGVGGVLIPAGLCLDALGRAILGEPFSIGGFVSEISEPLSTGIPLAGVWFYYGKMLTSEVAALPDTPRRAGLRRLYSYILAFVGLTATFLGIQALLSFLIDLMIGVTAWGYSLRSRLAGALATLLVGLPLWVTTWRPMNIQAAQEGEPGDHARRSLVRKIYLYLALFAGVIGVMVSAGSLIYQLLSSLLGEPQPNFARESWILCEMLVLFSVLLAYHWNALRADGRLAEQSLAARHQAYPVLVLAEVIGDFSEALTDALQREMPSLPVAVHVVDGGIPDETLSGAQAVILPGKLAANPPEAIRLWLQSFGGTRIVAPTPAEGWLWTFGSGRPLVNLANQAANLVRHLAEGQETPKPRESSSWMIALYILAGMVGAPLLIWLISILVELLF